MLDKGTVGNTAGGVVHSIWLDDGKILLLMQFFMIFYDFLIYNFIIL